MHATDPAESHPSYPSVPAYNRAEYTIRWETWHQEIPAIEQQPWKLYDGAWGEVGDWVQAQSEGLVSQIADPAMSARLRKRLAEVNQVIRDGDLDGMQDAVSQFSWEFEEAKRALREGVDGGRDPRGWQRKGDVADRRSCWGAG